MIRIREKEISESKKISDFDMTEFKGINVSGFFQCLDVQ
jgi:hypothetical protein